MSYLFGGPLADKFQPRKLMGISLILTAIGGFVYANNPSYTTLKILYGYWGFTTICLFWAGMIKATRIWGGTDSQGKAFGFLDGGRGLVGALFGLLGVLIFAFLMPDNDVDLNTIEQRQAFKAVILITSGIVILIGLLVYFFLKLDTKGTIEKETIKEHITLKNIKDVLQLKAVWLLMIIILCAYVGYKLSLIHI